MRVRVAIAGMLAATAWACHENDHAPLGDPGGGGEDNNSGIPDGGDTDTDSETGTGDSACGDGEVEQPDAGLCWLRCPLDQEATQDGECAGTAGLYAFNEASAACAALGGGYHAATRAEMIGLLDGCESAVTAYGEEGLCDSCALSATCAGMFESDWETYWTSTPGNWAPWAVSFDSGAVFMAATGLELYAARCVRYGD